MQKESDEATPSEAKKKSSQAKKSKEKKAKKAEKKEKEKKVEEKEKVLYLEDMQDIKHNRLLFGQTNKSKVTRLLSKRNKYSLSRLQKQLIGEQEPNFKHMPSFIH